MPTLTARLYAEVLEVSSKCLKNYLRLIVLKVKTAFDLLPQYKNTLINEK